MILVAQSQNIMFGILLRLYIYYIYLTKLFEMMYPNVPKHVTIDKTNVWCGVNEFVLFFRPGSWITSGDVGSSI